MRLKRWNGGKRITAGNWNFTEINEVAVSGNENIRYEERKRDENVESNEGNPQGRSLFLWMRTRMNFILRWW